MRYSEDIRAGRISPTFHPREIISPPLDSLEINDSRSAIVVRALK